MQTNLAILIGNLGKDAKVHTKNDRTFATFSVATSTRYKKDGEYVTHTEWHQCIVFGPLAEHAAKLAKGTRVMVQGAIRHTEYNGSKRDSIVISSFLKLDPKQKVENDAQEHDDIPEDALTE